MTGVLLHITFKKAIICNVMYIPNTVAWYPYHIIDGTVIKAPMAKPI